MAQVGPDGALATAVVGTYSTSGRVCAANSSDSQSVRSMGRRHSYLHLDSKYVLENLQAQAENCFRGRAATPKAVSGETVGLRPR